MTAPDAIGVAAEQDGTTISKQQWKWSVLAAMASYLDASAGPASWLA